MSGPIFDQGADCVSSSLADKGVQATAVASAPPPRLTPGRSAVWRVANTMWRMVGHFSGGEIWLIH